MPSGLKGRISSRKNISLNVSGICDSSLASNDLSDLQTQPFQIEDQTSGYYSADSDESIFLQVESSF